MANSLHRSLPYHQILHTLRALPTLRHTHGGRSPLRRRRLRHRHHRLRHRHRHHHCLHICRPGRIYRRLVRRSRHRRSGHRCHRQCLLLPFRQPRHHHRPHRRSRHRCPPFITKASAALTTVTYPATLQSLVSLPGFAPRISAALACAAAKVSQVAEGWAASTSTVAWVSSLRHFRPRSHPHHLCRPNRRRCPLRRRRHR
mmetsp:Transcript_20210/g.61525  ORF Transcript_20210/g.61525 Transcript_20210/m.61525 type:complete len:200 (+) Transcript_20210:95-694(+)